MDRMWRRKGSYVIIFEHGSSFYYRKTLILKKIFVLTVMFLFACGSAYALHEWFEGYKLEPYWSKSKTPLIIEYPNGFILDLVENRAVARGEYPITSLTMNSRINIENNATSNSIVELKTAVGQIRISTNERLSNLAANNESLAKDLFDYIDKNVSIIHYRIFTMGNKLRATSAVKYEGRNGLLGVIYPYLAKKETSLTAASSDEISNPTKNINVSGNYTGLIVDTKGLKVEPAVDPVIIDQQENEILGQASEYDIDLLSAGGKVDYADSINAAKDNGRAGKNPLIIKASGARRDCDPIVSDTDAHRIVEENKKTGFLSKLRIVIII